MISLEEAILIIQDAAINPKGSSGISKKLSFQQAWSIVLRSRQLQWDADNKTGFPPEILSRQTEICWKKQYK